MPPVFFTHVLMPISCSTSPAIVTLYIFSLANPLLVPSNTPRDTGVMNMADDIREREVKETTVVKAPPTGRKFPCVQCGAKLDFDPSVRGLKCPYCGHAEKIERKESAEIIEREYLEYLDKEEAKGQAIPGHGSQTQCPGCGAVVLLDDKVATDKCPFCTTHLETKPVAVTGMLAPESLVPFRLDLRQARESFNKWIASLWFAPTELKKVLALGQLTGIYLPYWTYDSMTYTFYEGQRGDDYTETQYYSAQNAQGQSETRSRTVVRTRWSAVSGEVQNFFDDVLVPATQSLSNRQLDGLGSFKLHKLEPFDAAYLSGFQTERYAVNLKEGFKQAKQLMEPEIVSLIRRDIGGDHQTIDNKKTRYNAITFKHLLLPVWVAAYRYNAKVYQITINGQTGEVAGERPWSKSKLALLIVAVLFVLAVIAAVVMFAGGNSKKSRQPSRNFSQSNSAVMVLASRMRPSRHMAMASESLTVTGTNSSSASGRFGPGVRSSAM
jgi:predicted RNA-binding Zn-ribbon protein involved in translation (DUF1610 family)